MPSARSEDALLALLSAPEYDASEPENAAQLRQVFRKSNHHVVAKAAELVAHAKLADRAVELVSAFERFLIDPLKSDKNCIGKNAIVDALNELDYRPAEIFLKGLSYVQMEPVFGGRADSAPPIRAACAAALVRIDYPQALELLIDLLMDPVRSVRVAAVRAIGAYGTPAAPLLLRLKARLGDPEAEVTGECLSEMILREPIESIAFAAEFLLESDDIAEVALLALGNSRRAEAFETLRAFWEKGPPIDLLEATLVAMALLRQPVATKFLLDLLRRGDLEEAKLALSALAILAYDPRLKEQCQAAVSRRGEKQLCDLLEKSLGLDQP
jgi:HEAT repeat protein